MKRNETKVVFSMSIASSLIARGHKVISTMPNPEEPKYTSWIFEVDDTFDDDLKEILSSRKGGK